MQLAGLLNHGAHAQRRMRGTFDFAVIDDHARLPWRFLERHIARDGLTGA
jgi:hypothetical protein